MSRDGSKVTAQMFKRIAVMDAWKTVISLFWSWKSVRVFAVLDLVVAGSSLLDLYVSGKPHDLGPFC